MQHKACLTALVVVTLVGSVALAIPAFPGAEGFGAVTAGGRGGTVYEVTTLADSGPGSFRAACTASGTRTVVFRVAGTIHLDTELSVANPYITIAGQTAPGGGVCIAGETVSLDTHDIVVRHMRFRRGETNYDRRDDALGSDTSSGNIIIDHCSTSWGLDENLSIYRYRKPDTTYGPTQNVTIQYSISSEALNTYGHAFGATWGGTMCSYHHNLFACNTGRIPSLSYPMVLDFRNNVLYNWDYRTIDGADGRAQVNIADNYYKSGPVTDSGELRYRIVKPDNRPPTDAYPGTGVWYVEGNYVVGYPGITADNWSGGVQYDGYLDPSLHRAYVPFAAPPLAEDDTAEEADLRVLAEAGATRPGRDAVDVRVVGMVAAGTVTYTLGKGIITDPSQVGGWPTYATGTPPTDSDHDG
ncbi:MAG: polysaccharide lyase, partial [Phycisphaerae bacterium]|nr:polysaccharide lyase [Phycisphaerae bacterium]